MANAAERLYRRLLSQYGPCMDFKRICRDQRIAFIKADLGESTQGVYIRNGENAWIFVNKNLSRIDRRCFAYHELFHHFINVHSESTHYENKNERCANLFAALCMIPRVEWGDTIDTIIERHGVAYIIAKARLDHANKELMRKVG